MVSGGRGGSVMFWAWAASIVVHLIVLGVFGAVKFSQSETQNEHRPVPAAKVSQVKKLMQAVPVIPKPKVKKPVKDRFSKRTGRILPAKRIFDTIKPGSQAPIADGRGSQAPARSWQGLADASASQSVFLMPGGAGLPRAIEFFGSRTEGRKVCYLVDCSGSMQGMFGRVRKELKQSISGLQPDQYFYIIFFGGGKLFEFGDGRLLRATKEAKAAAQDFIDLAGPAGKTNALAALERAVQIRDSSARSLSIIYFLTDGFELTTEGERSFPRKVANLLKRFAPEARINAIGFWPQSDDRRMLEAIAAQSGGEFVFITDGVTN